MEQQAVSCSVLQLALERVVLRYNLNCFYGVVHISKENFQLGAEVVRLWLQITTFHLPTEIQIECNDIGPNEIHSLDMFNKLDAMQCMSLQTNRNFVCCMHHCTSHMISTQNML